LGLFVDLVCCGEEDHCGTSLEDHCGIVYCLILNMLFERRLFRVTLPGTYAWHLAITWGEPDLFTRSAWVCHQSGVLLSCVFAMFFVFVLYCKFLYSIFGHFLGRF